MTGLRTRYRVVAGLLVVIALALTLRRLDLPEVKRLIGDADWSLLAAAAALVVAPLALRSLRAAFIFRRAGHGHVPLSTMTAVTVFGFSMSSVTPGGVGDLFRLAPLARHGVGARDAGAIVIYERAMDVVVMLALLSVAMAVTLAPRVIAVAALSAIAAAIGLAAIAWWRRASLPALPQRLTPAFVQCLLPRPATTAALLAPSTFSATLGLTILIFAFEAVRPWLVIRALGLDVNVLEAWVLFTLPLLAGLVTLLPLGLGSWEAAAVWTFGIYGFGANTGAAGAVLMRAGVTVPTLLAGAVALIALRRVLLTTSEASVDGAEQDTATTHFHAVE